MQLIDDIEAQVAINGESFRGPLLREAWPRIVEALLAGDLMAHRIRNDYEPGHPAWAEMESFRAATEGTK